MEMHEKYVNAVSKECTKCNMREAKLKDTFED